MPSLYGRIRVGGTGERSEPARGDPEVVDWRALVFRRTSRLIAAAAAPTAVWVALSPGHLRLLERSAVLIMASAAILVAVLARDPRRARALAAVLIATIIAACLVLAARVGMAPALPLGLGSAIVLVAVFFEPRAVLWVGALTTLALLALGGANNLGLLRPADPATVFDWTKMSTWLRVIAAFVAAISVATAAVVTLIAQLEDAVRARARLLSGERRARLRIGRLQEVTACMSRAKIPEEVFDAACRGGGEAMEAQSAGLWTLEDDGTLRLAGSWGATPELRNRFHVVPASVKLPAEHVARTGRPLWVETEDDFRAMSPELHERARAAGELASLGILPLAVDGVVKGAVAFTHPVGHHLDADARAYYTTLSLHCSQAFERANLHAAALEAAARAEAANRLKDEFLSTVSHELRTPLTAIRGWAHMLHAGVVPPERRDHAMQVIERNSRAQEKLIEELLDVSRITAGRLRLSVGPIEPAKIVLAAIDSVKPAAQARGVGIASALDSVEPVLGDAGRLHQVVCNLLTNAVNFSPDGGRVSVALSSEPPNAVITVRDHGEGIDPSFLPHVFEPFRQGAEGLARPHGGLGLGLTIAKRLVELHEGTIEARSDGKGQGATLVVRLPTGSAGGA